MKTKKKILICVDWYYPGFKAGGPIRSCINMVKSLSGEFDFFVLTSDTDYHSEAPYPGIKAGSWTKGPFGESVLYVSQKQKKFSTVNAIIRETNPDILYLNSMFSVPFTLFPVLSGFKGKLILAPRGMLSPSAIQIKLLKKKIFLFLFRLFQFHKKILFQATSGYERDHILKVFPGAYVFLAPNLPDFEPVSESRALKKKKGSLILVSIARISPEKNLLYALETLKGVRALVEFNIYGPVHDVNYEAQCKNVGKNLPGNIKVNFAGPVDPKAIPDILKSSHLFFLPTRGENFGHILIDSMKYGCPVLTSDQTPWGNLHHSKAGIDISLSDQPTWVNWIECFAEMDQDEWEQWRTGAMQYFSKFQMENQSIALTKNLFS